MALKAKKRTKGPAPLRKGGAAKQTHYRIEFDAITTRLVQLTGATVSDIAEILGVSVATIYNWQSRHESFRHALRIPESIANHRVELSAYQEAVGYFVDEEEIKIIDGKVLRVKKKVWQRPNPTAIVWWTKVKAGWTPAEAPPRPQIGDDGDSTIDETGQETDRQVARKFLFLVEKDSRKA